MAPKKGTNLSKHLNQRENARNGIDRICQLIETNGSSLSKEQLQCRLDLLESYFSQWNSQQEAVEQYDYELENTSASSIRGELDEVYCEVKAKIMTLISATDKNTTDIKSKSPVLLSDNLPKLRLPQFTGKYAEYPNFIQLFTTLIHNDHRLTDIEKFNFLISCLSGAALRTVKGLDISATNYASALAMLDSRYKNKFLMCEEHIKEMFGMPKITRGSAEQLRGLIDDVTARFNALCNLSTYEELTNAMVVHVVMNALDNESQQKLEESVNYSEAITWSHCAEVLAKRCQVLEARTNSKVTVVPNRGKTNQHLSLATSYSRCVQCNEQDHPIWKCQQFLNVPPAQRLEMAKAAKVCLNCLATGHTRKQCKASSCKECKGNHHTLLHLGYRTQQMQHPVQHSSSTQHTQQLAPQQRQQQSRPHNAQADNSYQQVNLQQSLMETPMNSNSWPATAMVSKQYNSEEKLNAPPILATAVLDLHDKFGQRHRVRALLDSASQLNFVTRKLTQKFHLNKIQADTVIDGIAESHTNANQLVTAKISSQVSEFSTTLPFVVLQTITSQQPAHKFDIENWNIPANISLADERFNIPQNIDMLIGADIFFDLLNGQKIDLGSGFPMLIHTSFGWVVSGRYKSNGNASQALISTTTAPAENLQLEQLVKQFWELEKIPDSPHKMSKEHADCEAHFIRNTKRLATGRFMVKLPMKDDPMSLGDTRNTAMRRFYALERRFLADKNLKDAYTDFLQQYESDGHMEQTEWPISDQGYYFIPHHCVWRPEKSTTKCRVVFDASMKSSTNLSLNDIMMVGPVVQRELYDILLRFRLHRYGLMADISAMYRQIEVHPEDQRLQNIIWRSDQCSKLKLFKLKTVTYGTAAAPYLATRCLVQLAQDNWGTNQQAAQVIKNDFYVDDLITGGESLAEIEKTKQDVSDILQQARFHLRKWCSNHSELLAKIPEEEREKLITINESSVVKALGIIWDPNADCFKFQFTSSEANDINITKRTVLSELSKLFDPIGFIKPLIVKAKVFMQELWLKGLTWDETLPAELIASWLKYTKQLSELNQLCIPRFVLLPNASVQLHGFADASNRAYGCCFYVRCMDADGNTKVSLYTAKSKVAPISTVRTLPCLELSAAHMLVQLLQKIRHLLQVDKIILWTDSIIVLSWLAQHASNYNTFVANRVGYIQEAAEGINWRYVPSSNNPADIVSRGATVQELKSSIWFNGPEFLQKQEACWPSQPKRVSAQQLPERKQQVCILLAVQQNTLLDKIYATSDYGKNCRRMAYILRCVNFCKDPTNRTSKGSVTVTADEFTKASHRIVSMIQQSTFSTEISMLKAGKTLHSQSSLKALNPFLDVKDGVELLRVGGRLKNAHLPYDAKCPLVLPKNNEFVASYFRWVHKQNLHAGAQAMLSFVQEKFWVIGARYYARNTVKHCIHCFKYRPKLLTQIMGNLPEARVAPSKPFTYCGVDFCGPILTTWRIRGKSPYKSYIAVFVCFVTKAVHLEVVSALTADAFIGCLKRFTARRGLCTTLYCDNATNFVGARNVLKEFKAAFLNENVQNQLALWCTKNEIEFKHIPPRAPHFGGIWEAAVKSAKSLLYRTMQSVILTYEELSTVTTQIEGILNSRPLMALSSDPSDETALTPAHFLNQSKAECIIEPEVDFNKISSCKRWQQITAIHQHFWRRWSKEYLSTLQHRRKWDVKLPNLAVGALVMVHDDNLPPQKWLIGRIVKSIPGEDGAVRVTDIKTPAGIIRRAVAKLAVLPLPDNLVEPS